MTKRKYRKYNKRYKIKKKRSIFRSKFFWFSLLIILLLSGIFYFFFLSPVFQIKRIEIMGNNKVSTEEIRVVVLDNYPRKILFFDSKSIFLVNLKKVDKKLKERFPKIAKISLKRDFPNGLISQIEERIPIADWCYENDCFHIDNKGIVFEKTEKETNIKIKTSNSLEDLSLLDKVIEEDKLQSILFIKKELKYIEIEEFLFKEKLTAKVLGGWEIYFDLDKEVKEQIFNLNTVLKEKIPPENRGNLEYIDLRFGNRIFVSPENLIDVINEN